MSIIAPSEGASIPLESVLRQAGAVFLGRDGSRVAVHYGSPAGELAVCVRAVGIVDRSSLSKLLIEAPRLQLSLLTSRLIGSNVAAGGALQAAGAWWCGDSDGSMIVLSEPRVARRLKDRLREHAVHYAALSVRDCTTEWAAIELLGPATRKLLTTLGTYGAAGDPRSVPPFTTATVANRDVRWLLQSDNRALALVSIASAGEVWKAIERAGRPYGISCVGSEAARHYALLNR